MFILKKKSHSIPLLTITTIFILGSSVNAVKPKLCPKTTENFSHPQPKENPQVSREDCAVLPQSLKYVQSVHCQSHLQSEQNIPVLVKEHDATNHCAFTSLGRKCIDSESSEKNNQKSALDHLPSSPLDENFAELLDQFSVDSDSSEGSNQKSALDHLPASPLDESFAELLDQFSVDSDSSEENNETKCFSFCKYPIKKLRRGYTIVQRSIRNLMGAE